MGLALNSNRRLNRRVGIVADEVEVLEFKVVDVFYVGIDLHSREGPWFTGQLETCLVKVIAVEVKVSESVDECARLYLAGLGYHEGQQRIRGDVEGDTQKKIGAALV